MEKDYSRSVHVERIKMKLIFAQRKCTRQLAQIGDLSSICERWRWSREPLLWFTARLKPSRLEFMLSLTIMEKMKLNDLMRYMLICIVIVEVLDHRRLTDLDIQKISRSMLGNHQVDQMARIIAEFLTKSGPLYSYEIYNTFDFLKSNEQIVPNLAELDENGKSVGIFHSVPENEI